MKGMGGKLFYCKFVTSSTLAKKQKKNQVESCPLSKIKLEFVDFVHALAPPLVQPHNGIFFQGQADLGHPGNSM